VNPSVLEPKSDDEITLVSKLYEGGFVVDMEELNKPKGYCEGVYGLNGQVWIEAVDRELDSLDMARTWIW
jgi:hypothetical protein